MAISDENIAQSDAVEPDSNESARASAGDAAGPARDASAGDGSVNMDFVLDIPLEVTVELGRTKMLIDDLLKLTKGSVVELSKLAGEPMEVRINERLVARGEVVVVNEKFGVRLTDIISASERKE